MRVGGGAVCTDRGGHSLGIASARGGTGTSEGDYRRGAEPGGGSPAEAPGWSPVAGRCRGGRVVGGAQPAQAGFVGEGQDRQRPAGRRHQQIRGRSLGRTVVLPPPLGGGDEVVAQGTQCGYGGVQDVVGDRFDLRRNLGRGEGVQVRGEVGSGPGLLGQWMRVTERLGVAPRPPLQVAAGGEPVPGGVDLVGVAADVVVQVEVRVTRGDAKVLRGLGRDYSSSRSSVSSKPSSSSSRVSCW